MTALSVHEFLEQKECTYRDEHYSVRDNGAVFRHPRGGKRVRPIDNMWTFGNENSSTGYLYISRVQIHRIVATAFHGEPEDAHHVVDHIDTNRRNNRPENLRWLTRLENVLKNPMTRRRIEFYCGSIEAFLENPSLLREATGNQNFEWMRAVTPQEAKNCKDRMHIWASSPSSQRALGPPQLRMPTNFSRVYQPFQKWEAGLDREPGLDFAMTPRSAQYMWSSEIYFPCCPMNIGTDPLDDYLRSTSAGAILAYSEDPNICPELTVSRIEYLRDKGAILVLCSRAGMGWTIVGIRVTQRGSPHFIHFCLGSYSSEVDANKAFREKESVDFWSDGYANAARYRQNGSY